MLAEQETELAFNPQKKEVEILCELHGSQRVTIFKLVAEWSKAECPECKRLRQEEAAQWAETEQVKWQQATVQSNLKRAEMPLRFANKTFEDYRPLGDAGAKALNDCRAYADQFPARLAAGASLILCGTTGTGKTHLACAIASTVVTKHNALALYSTAGKALRKVKDTFGSKTGPSEQEVLNQFRYYDLLILDEVGVQYGSDTERNILFEIINGRYEMMKPTVLISNLALTELKEFVGDRVIDRMRENGGRMVIFDWASNRIKAGA